MKLLFFKVREQVLCLLFQMDIDVETSDALFEKLLQME